MTRYFQLLIIICGLVACGPKEMRITLKTFPDGKIEKEKIIPDLKDSLRYVEITYFYNGIRKLEQEFFDGKFNGRLLEFYENGNKKFEGVTQMSHFVGIKYDYDSLGLVSQTDSLFDKCLASECCCDAVITRFYNNGNIKEKFTIKSGLINGQVFSYYENGSIESIRGFVDEKEDGKSVFWKEDGKIEYETTYRQGIRHGFRKEYHDDFTSEGYYENGKEVGEWKYVDTSGNLIKVEHYKNGELIH